MMAILDPIKLVIDNYPEGEVEWLTAENNLENESLGQLEAVMPFRVREAVFYITALSDLKGIRIQVQRAVLLVVHTFLQGAGVCGLCYAGVLHPRGSEA